MAAVTVTELIDDLDGKPIASEDAHTIRWSWAGVTYELDTSAANLDRIENGRVPVSKLLSSSRRTGGRRASTALHSRATTPTSGEQTRAVRDWANRNGYSVGPRGRIPQHIIEAFAAAH